MGRIKFGTDGWRAVIAEEFTFTNVERVAQATADYWNANPIAGTQSRAIVGFDRRFLSDQFARRVAEILAGNGLQVTLSTKPTPTPAVSLAVKAQRAIGGVMITASHNPAAFNGFKLKALTTTSMVDKMCAARGLELTETPVGFKYVATEMLKGSVLLGFEESGGIGFPGHIPERDGILAGLMLLELLATERKPVNALITDLEKQFGPHHYGRIDTHFPLEKRAVLMEFCKNNPPATLLRSAVAEVKSFDGVKFIAADGSWLMLRGSGTEPILRIYAEAKSNAAARKLLNIGVQLTQRV